MNVGTIAKYFVLYTSIFAIVVTTDYTLSAAIDPGANFTDEYFAEKIPLTTDIVEAKYTPVVKVYLKNYITRYPKYTQKLLGRKTLYFPYIEKLLAENNLPEDLKYLPVVESGLIPNARSVVGATGLWQFMSGTAKMSGLTINQHVDERRNPIKSTEAAIRHLKKLYGIYEDWSLVLAAYNSGPGNVNKAIKRANSRDFWAIRPYLPKETREYVPAFIAATYLFKNYMNHDLSLELPELDYQVTGQVKIFKHTTFKEIADWTNLSLDLIKALNPGFKQNYIPSTYNGYVIVVPMRVIKYLEANQNNIENNIVEKYVIPDGKYEPMLFEGYAGDALLDIAEHFNVSVDNIYTWNGTYIEDTLSSNLDINLFIFVEEGPIIEKNHFRAPRDIQTVIFVESRNIASPSLNKSIEGTGVDQMLPAATLNPSPNHKAKRIKLKKGQTLQELLDEYPDTTIDKLLKLNQVKSVEDLKVGMYLRFD